ncbi:hypothetical protein HMPREF1092_03273 [Clostridium thermobutyricum]|uniref:Uncharacterized protein n=2 Tax=Clostridium thermobutyricum TaxID=29372 RepID=N9W6U6_9CLOT|nr:hypothetical protein [Clostridium thermobutyricum]ENY98715.1 hypothetical protein HMPREF1092_03273 [Clostridium thermobutyricum]OPX47919.1 hypothetical protein CLTHE_14900 [Clostridium thermobutyricum DSM 4928]
MFIKKIRFQRTKGAKIESGWWIGKYEYAEDCIILDSKYNPIIKDKNGCLCWDYVTDWKNPVLIQVDNN